MMRHTYLTSFFIVTAIAMVACGNTNSIKDKTTVEKLLEKQLQQGMYWEQGTTGIPNEHTYGEEDLTVTSELIDEQLAERGFKSNPSLFRQRVKEIFNIDIDTMPVQIDISNENYYLLDTIGVEFFEHEMNSTILLSPKENILLFPYLIPQIIDYKKRYPDIAQLEDTLSPTRETIYGKVNVTKWGDSEARLNEQREYNIDNLFHANNYLIHNQEESLNWLLQNNSNFISQLLTTFGYDKDDRINKHVLEHIHIGADNSYSWYDLMVAFTRKDVNGSLHIHENLLKYMRKNANNNYASMIYKHANYCIDYEDNSYFTKAERFKIAAYMAYYLRLIYLDNLKRSGIDKDYIFIGDMLFRAIGDLIDEEGDPSNEGNDSEFLNAIVENNYYDLPDFEKMIDSIIEDCRIDNNVVR